MPKTPTKTNASRLLDQAGITHELVGYEVDPDDLSAEKVADQIGLPRARVFKTLVLLGDGGRVLLACVPAGTELALKALARAAGCKKIEMAPLKEVQPLTGYIRGGVSPVGTKSKYPVFLDESAREHERIAVSAGIRGCQMLLAPGDLLAVTGGRYAGITMEKGLGI